MRMEEFVVDSMRGIHRLFEPRKCWLKWRTSCYTATAARAWKSTVTVKEHASSLSPEALEQVELLKEAAFLTKSLYRTCLRSVRVIRYGNEHDEKEFQAREKERLQKELDRQRQVREDPRLGMLSMLPPVDRVDELRSRAEYYLQYARENFVQESDCLRPARWDHPRMVERYIHFLRQGEKHRRWLLSDMKFADPYQHSFDEKRVKAFEQRAMDLSLRLQRRTDLDWASSDPRNTEETDEQIDDANFWDDDGDDDEEDDRPQPLYKDPRRS